MQRLQGHHGDSNEAEDYDEESAIEEATKTPTATTAPSPNKGYNTKRKDAPNNDDADNERKISNRSTRATRTVIPLGAGAAAVQESYEAAIL